MTTNVWCPYDKEKRTDTLVYEPKEGTIAPYSKTRVTFILNPKVEQLTKGFKSQEPAIDKQTKNFQYLGTVQFRAGAYTRTRSS